MSHTYIRTDNNTRRNTQANDSVARNRINYLERRVNEVTDRANRDRRSYERRISDINRRTENEIRNMRRHETELENEVAQIRTDANRALNDLAAQHARDMSQVQNTIRDTSRRIYADMDTMQNRLTQQMQEGIGALRSEVNVRFEAIEDTIQAERNDRQTMLDGAAEYAETARGIIDNAVANHRADVLLPNRRSSVDQALADALYQIEFTREHPGNASVARASARTALQEAILFEQEVLAAEYAWEIARAQAVAALTGANEEITAAEHVTLEDEGNFEVDTELYSGGAISGLRREAGALSDQIESNGDRLTMDDLSGIGQRALAIGEDANNAARYAVEACLRSQDRADISDSISDELRDRFGMTVSDFAYQGNEFPAGTRLHLKNPVTGFEMMVSCSPVESDGHVVNEITADVLNYGSFTNNPAAGDDIARQAIMIISQERGMNGPITMQTCEERKRPESLLAGDMETFERETAQYPVYTAE